MLVNWRVRLLIEDLRTVWPSYLQEIRSCNNLADQIGFTFMMIIVLVFFMPFYLMYGVIDCVHKSILYKVKPWAEVDPEKLSSTIHDMWEPRSNSDYSEYNRVVKKFYENTKSKMVDKDNRLVFDDNLALMKFMFKYPDMIKNTSKGKSDGTR